MWLAETPAGLTPAAPETTGHCPSCGSPVIPKCGDLLAWHWAHLANPDCDEWSSEMGEWHREWQAAAPPLRREVPIGPHRADIVTVDGRIFEVQHSALSTEEIAERERFYGGDLIWLWDARAASTDERITLRPDSRSEDELDVNFHWPHSRRSIGMCSRTVYLDLGDSVLVVGRHNDTMSWGTGRLWTPDDVGDRIAAEGPCERRFPACADARARARLTPGPDIELRPVPIVRLSDQGPCAVCSKMTTVYGPNGAPLCGECKTRPPAAYRGYEPDLTDPQEWEPEP